MIQTVRKYFSLLLLTLFISCSGKSEKKETFFGGKIINPKTKFVVLYAMNKVIDTLLLDEKNKFLGTYTSLKEGLYYFEHGNENQYIYIEPQDSLMLRLNTWDFDESLVFAGRGAERNNILTDIFLEDENQNLLFYNLNKLQPNLYQKKIDSILDVRLFTFKEYADKHPNETSGYFNILKTALTYPIFSRIERYPINNIKLNNLKDFTVTNDSFYSYRNSIRFNNDSLMYYTPYARYVRNYLYNLTYKLGHKPMNEEFSESFTIDLLKTIDAKINSKETKNAFLKRTVLDHFYKKSSCSIHTETFNTFFKLTTNDTDKIQIENLLEENKILSKGDRIKDFSILDFTEKEINIQEFTQHKKSVLLFWNKDYFSKAFLSSRISYLEKKFPDLNFAVIEINGNSNNRISNIDIKNQYYIKTAHLKNNFLLSQMPRTILVNKNGIVENGYASISSRKFYNQLKRFSKNN